MGYAYEVSDAVIFNSMSGSCCSHDSLHGVGKRRTDFRSKFSALVLITLRSNIADEHEKDNISHLRNKSYTDLLCPTGHSSSAT